MYFEVWLILFFSIFRLISGYGVNDQLWFEVISPEEVAYSYKIRQARDFGSLFTETLQHAHLVFADPEEGCGAIENAKDLRGNVAMVKRGGCSFLSKSINAELSGALAVIITNNSDDDIGHWVEMVGDESGRNRLVGIPAVFMLGKDGRKIRDSIRSHNSKWAIINIPVNYTLDSYVHQPPWDHW